LGVLVESVLGVDRAIIVPVIGSLRVARPGRTGDMSIG
jgi:hypothetical protein